MREHHLDLNSRSEYVFRRLWGSLERLWDILCCPCWAQMAAKRNLNKICFPKNGFCKTVLPCRREHRFRQKVTQKLPPKETPWKLNWALVQARAPNIKKMELSPARELQRGSKRSPKSLQNNQKWSKKGSFKTALPCRREHHLDLNSRSKIQQYMHIYAYLRYMHIYGKLNNSTDCRVCNSWALLGASQNVCILKVNWTSQLTVGFVIPGRSWEAYLW